MRVRGAAAVALVAALGVTGCRQLVGLADGTQVVGPADASDGADASSVADAASGADAPDLGDATTSETGPPDWGGSACGQCVQGACASEVAACKEDDSCAVYLACLGMCPLDTSGNLVPSCAANCQVPSTDDAAVAAAVAFSICRLSGAGTTCTTCNLGPTCSPSSGQSACDRCTNEACCGVMVACQEANECADVLSCMAACAAGAGDAGAASDAAGSGDSGDAGEAGDASQAPGAVNAECEAQCLAEHPQGYTPYGAYVSCQWVDCGSACGGDCVACLDAHCAPEMTQCLAIDGTCASLYLCLESCGADADPGACEPVCFNAYGNGLTDYDVFQGCAQANCASQCQ